MPPANLGDDDLDEDPDYDGNGSFLSNSDHRVLFGRTDTDEDRSNEEAKPVHLGESQKGITFFEVPFFNMLENFGFTKEPVMVIIDNGAMFSIVFARLFTKMALKESLQRALLNELRILLVERVHIFH
jgi:hypothetical protein